MIKQQIKPDVQNNKIKIGYIFNKNETNKYQMSSMD